MVRSFSPRRPELSNKGIGLFRRFKNEWLGLAGAPSLGDTATAWLISFSSGELYVGSGDTESWQPSTRDGDTPSAFVSMCWDPFNDRYLGLGNDSHIYASFDGHEWFIVQNNVGIESPSNHESPYLGFDYFTEAGLFLCTNGDAFSWSEDGNSWFSETSTPLTWTWLSLAWDGEKFGAFRNRSDNPQMIISSDGKEWTGVNIGFNPSSQGAWSDHHGLWISQTHGSDEIQVSPDTSSWSISNSTTDARSFIAAVDDNILVGYNSLFLSTDGGETFSQVASFGLRTYALAGVGSSFILGGGESGRVARSYDSGTTWEDITGDKGLSTPAGIAIGITPNVVTKK